MTTSPSQLPTKLEIILALCTPSITRRSFIKIYGKTETLINYAVSRGLVARSKTPEGTVYTRTSVPYIPASEARRRAINRNRDPKTGRIARQKMMADHKVC